MLDRIKAEISASLEVKNRVLASDKIQQQLQELAMAAIHALKNNGKIIFCGNGGSFGDSQHLAAELVSRLRFDRDALASVALGTNSSNLTAIGNDYGYEQVFSRELRAIGNANDIFIPISTSGNSPNVLRAIETAKAMGITTYAFTGRDGGKMASMCNCIIVPSDTTDKIQEIHIMFGHIACHLIESEIFGK